MPRKTADLIALILAVVVAVVVIATTLALLSEQLRGTNGVLTPAVDFIRQTIAVLVAALVGYMAGRGSHPQ